MRLRVAARLSLLWRHCYASGSSSPGPRGRAYADFSHLPVASSFSSLVELLSSPRSNEEIQLELVEILGFEGAGLQLVEDILKPGTRGPLVAELSSDLGSRTASQVSNKHPGSEQCAG